MRSPCHTTSPGCRPGTGSGSSATRSCAACATTRRVERGSPRSSCCARSARSRGIRTSSPPSWHHCSPDEASAGPRAPTRVVRGAARMIAHADDLAERRPAAPDPPRWILHGIALLGLALRIAIQRGRAFGGDELGTLAYLKHDVGYLLTHFEGTLTMNWYLVLLKGLRAL